MISSTLAKMLGLKRKDFVIAGVVLFGLFYGLLIIASKYFILFFGFFFGITFIAYSKERNRTYSITDTFEDDNLFFRYGAITWHTLFLSLFFFIVVQTEQGTELYGKLYPYKMLC